MAEIDEAVSYGLRMRRAGAQLLQADVAQAMHWSQPTVSAAERGTKTFTLDEIYRLCQFFDVTLRDLLIDADPKFLTRLGL